MTEAIPEPVAGDVPSFKAREDHASVKLAPAPAISAFAPVRFAPAPVMSEPVSVKPAAAEVELLHGP